MKIPCETCVDEEHCSYNGSCYKQRATVRENSMKAINLRRYPTHAEVMDFEEMARQTKSPADFLTEKVAGVLDELSKNRVPASDLTNEQRFALLFSLGCLKMTTLGKFESIRPVSICDRGDGGYLIGIAPESHSDHRLPKPPAVTLEHVGH